MQIRKSIETDFQTILDIYNQAIPTHQITADLELASTENRRAWKMKQGLQGGLVFPLFMSALLLCIRLRLAFT